MPANVQMWIEVSFNVTYLIVVWGMVIAMARRQSALAPENVPVARRVMWAFTLLALGDTGHVGFRVVAYALGGLQANPLLLGLGALATAYTVTLFYVVMLDMWRVRFNKKYGWFEHLLLAAALVRLIMMALPQNEWTRVEAPEPWGIYRNLPLIAQGVGVMLLIWRDALAAKDNTFKWIGVSILVSYACFTPVILWANEAPLVGMLMIPKTMAYLVVAFLAYRELYRRPALATANA